MYILKKYPQNMWVQLSELQNEKKLHLINVTYFVKTKTNILNIFSLFMFRRLSYHNLSVFLSEIPTKFLQFLRIFSFSVSGPDDMQP
jgi:hypothetical protein